MRPSDEQIQEAVERASARKTTATAPEGKRPALDPAGLRARRSSLRAATGDQREADRRLERIIKGNELNDVNYLSRGMHAARSVARIVVRREDRTIGYGTGFLVAPGVLVTNEHVLREPATVGTCTAQLQYELDARGNEVPPVEFALLEDPAPVIDAKHDLAVVAVADVAADGTPLDRFGWLNLDPTPGKSPEGEWLTIVQHPGGERKQLCVRENKLVAYDADEIHLTYTTDTVGGSSGSPVFNNSWDVVALHHSGVPKMRKHDGVMKWVRTDGTLVEPDAGGSIEDEGELVWVSNEGVRVSAILRFLVDLVDDAELARRVCDAPTPPPPPGGPWPGEAGASGSDEHVLVSAGGNGVVSGAGQVVVPIELVIGLRAGAAVGSATVSGNGHTGTPTGQAPVVHRSGNEPSVAEAARPSDYVDRKGYDPTFLGAGFEIPLPKVTGRWKKDVLTFGDGETQLRYGTYSVVMHASRRLAFFSAANRERTTDEDDTAERKDSWKLDPRLGATQAETRELQLGGWFYEGNPFDQGHLTRFADTNWGRGRLAARNGKDSFHFPNCAPQHEDFNKNAKGHGIWWRLEDWVVDTFGAERLCIFNGPIFDAPRSTRRGKELILEPDGQRVPDPMYAGIPIPKQYFKVTAFEGRDGKLGVQAFIVTQEDLLRKVRLEEGLTERELFLYRVRVSVIKRLTGIDFGPVGKQGTQLNELAGATDVQPIHSLDDLTALVG